MSLQEVILGIDLGTTHSLVSVMKDGRPTVLCDGESPLIPSVVGFDQEGRIQSVGHAARTLKMVDPQRILFSTKRLMGRGKADLERIASDLPFDFSPSTDQIIRMKVGKAMVSPVEVAAAILLRCRFVAENALGHRVKKAVVTVPAYFDDAQRSATVMAGRLAGLEIVRIVNEPTAAALAFGFGKSAQQSVVAVYDFGGGTFDISILKVSGQIFEVLATDGDTALGGDHLDQALMDLLIAKVGHAPKTEEDRVLLSVQTETIKKLLSKEQEVSVQLHWANKVQWSGLISRSEVETVLSPLVARTISIVKKALKAANVSVSEINDVLLVGGSTRVPLVQNELEKLFGRKPNSSLNPDEAVALGACVQASILSGEVGDALLLDVVPLSLGLETMGGVVSKIIHRNSTVPTAATETFTTYADKQTAFDFHIVQGEREFVADCRSLARFKLRVPPLPAGAVKVQVSFDLNADGVLKVSAVDQKTMQSASIEVKPSFGLSDEQIEKMLSDAWAHAEEDVSKRVLVEARNKATTLLRATEKALLNPLLDDFYRATQRQLLGPVMKALEEDMRSEKSDLISVRTQELDHLTQSLAQEIMNRSVRAQLVDQSVEKVG
jgi:molecular chaperone DnaK (HSP70)